MSEIDLVAIASMLAWFLLYWPVSTISKSNSFSRKKALDLNWLNRLHAQAAVSANFVAAVDALNPNEAALDSKTLLRIAEISKLNSQSGLPASLLLKFTIRELSDKHKVQAHWQEKSANAKVASGLLLLLPIPVLLAASASGLEAGQWLLTSTYGILALLLATLLTAISLALQFWMRPTHSKTKLQSNLSSDRSTARQIQLPKNQRNLSALAVFIAVVSIRLDFAGVIAGAILARVFHWYWPRLSSRDAINFQASLIQQRPWVATVMACALSVGLDWPSAVKLAGEDFDSELKTQWQEIQQRLHWGIDAAQAFSLSAMDAELFESPSSQNNWLEISQVIEQSQSSGAPVSNALFSLATNWQNQSLAAQLARVEKRSATLVMLVSLLQLPAFLLLGVLPMLAATLIPIFSMFSSTGGI